MIYRFGFNIVYSLRNASFVSHIHGNWNLKLNSFKEYKLFHVSSVFFPAWKKKNEPHLEEEDTEHLKVLKLWKNMTVREVAASMKINLKDLGFLLPNINLKPDDQLDTLHILTPVAHKLGYKIKIIKSTDKEQKKKKKITSSTFTQQPVPKPENLVKRPPVVCVMGHVDHGKTTLLDSLRNTFVVDQEFGGITQHIGAFSVEVKSGDKITFIDTPGHAAFTSMRSRGAEVTDLVVLVIAADDGVMEQTVESIKIANAANVPIIIAVNKIDKPSALPIEEIKQKLLWEGIQVEDEGGDVQLVPISALKKINLDLLTETILLQAELMNLKGDPTGLVEGVVIESKKEKTGRVATIIIKRGTLRKEKIIVAGKAHAKVRRMLDEKGNDYKEATLSTPVQILGWRELPSAGDFVFEVTSEKQAKKLVEETEKKIMLQKQEEDSKVIEQKADIRQKEHSDFKNQYRSLKSWKEKKMFYFSYREKLKYKNKDEETGPHLKILLKGDVYGSLEVLTEILGSYNKNDECGLSIVDASVGDITISDLEIAETFDAIIYAFNVKLHQSTNEFLKEKPIKIHYHNVLYKLIDDVKEQLNLRILPKDDEEILGEAEVLENFNISVGKRKVPVAGARCIRGELNKDSFFKVIRNDEVIFKGKLDNMKHEKKVVKTISKGMECGLMLADFPDKFKPGDRIICYNMVKVKRNTSWNPGF